MAVRPGDGLEVRWKNAYKATRWLYENDNESLMAKLSTRQREPAEVEDAMFFGKVEVVVTTHYDSDAPMLRETRPPSSLRPSCRKLRWTLSGSSH